MSLIRIPVVVGMAAFLLPSVAMAACQDTLTADVQPIFNANCVACHQDAAPGAGLSLQRTSAYDMLIDTPSTSLADYVRVAPGDPDNSMLWLKLTGEHADIGAAGGQMPPGAQLADADLEIIKDWILGCEAE